MAPTSLAARSDIGKSIGQQPPEISSISNTVLIDAWLVL